MLTKQEIKQLKEDKLDDLYAELKQSKDNRTIQFILENLGKLPDSFDGDILLPFLVHSHDDIRLWAVKNLGKIQDTQYLDVLSEVAQNDDDSMVRREAISSLGRMRDRKTIPVLLESLIDSDPKITLQAIRGLLVFKHTSKIEAELQQLQNHPNEMIQEVITRELSLNGKKSEIKYPHPMSPDSMKNTVVHGDVRDTLQVVPADSIHLTFTSPPYYNARDYSIYVSYEAYLDFLTDVFTEVHRVTKEGRFLIVNTSPVIVPRFSRAYASKRYPIPFDLHARLTSIDWEFIDDIVWAKPETSVKNRNAGFLQHRKPIAYKPNPVTEYLMVYRKKSEKLIDWNIKQYAFETIEQSKVGDGYETSNLWQIDPTFNKIHSAVFPNELCNRVIKYYSLVGDLVFDPFGGSGTLGKVAYELKRHFFLTEMDNTYFEHIKRSFGGQPLFDEFPPRFLSLDEFSQTVSNFETLFE
ncbi:MAG: DNA methyltransferase [Anaerolineae bacterium]|nr:DNA methyltransferase [Anaerolineae bacterium]MDQ7035623.1 DNA methyltransferase [Anaerolineae bacterium]